MKTWGASFLKGLLCLALVPGTEESFFNPDAMIIVERLFGLAGHLGRKLLNAVGVNLMSSLFVCFGGHWKMPLCPNRNNYCSLMLKFGKKTKFF